MFRWISSVAAALTLWLGCATTPESPIATPATHTVATNENLARPKTNSFKLSAESFWRIELPQVQRLDASGLIWVDGKLLMVADGNPTLFEVGFGEANTAHLKKTEIFTWAQLTPFMPGKRGRFDFEGLARDERGRIYACEEANRWVFRFDPTTTNVERLEIDLARVHEYFSSDQNASFEGIAVGGGKLWLANERERARVIEVDLETLKVVGDFAPQPSFWASVTHYSDICWFEGHLFLLLRHHRVILQIEPTTREVLAEYNYMDMEEAPEHRYLRAYPTGTMEGLAVDKDYFWLLTDNNGFARQQESSDRRPTLFKCKRPD